MIWTHITVFATAAALSFGIAGANLRQWYENYNRLPPISGTGKALAVAHAGEQLPILWDLVKETDCPGYSGRVFEGPNGFYVSEPVQSNGLPRGEIKKIIHTDIPAFAPVGEIRMYIKGHYDCPNEDPQYFTLGPVLITVE